MSRLALHLLGPFQGTLDGIPVVHFRSDKTRALLAYLALEADRPHRRDALAGLLWPDVPNSTARNNLRLSLHRLRQVLGETDEPPVFLQVTPETIQFNFSSDVWLDVSAFDTSLAAVEGHLHQRIETCAECVAKLRKTAELYRGDFLQGFFIDSVAFSEWASLRREWLHRRAVEALCHLAEYHGQCGEHEQALRYAHRQLALEPWREEAHRQVMSSLARHGERSAALAQYERCRQVMVEELGVGPSTETVELYRRIRESDLTPRHNLPTQLTPFIGRQRELAEIAELLSHPDCRLITLHGPGGVGKTRLGLQVAPELLNEFPNGVWLVELASLADPSLVPQTAATVLDVKPQGNQPVLAALIHDLCAKKLLLVLDNCEHLIDACAQLAGALLRACPDVRLLATSREALGVDGEATLSVPSLSLPDPENATLAAIAEAEAVQLFVERATAASPGFALIEANAPTIAQVCRRLDGIALAIELAASRVKLLTVEQIAARLDDAFRFLTGGSRTALPRQQTLRATIDWSYNLLSEVERTLLRRLSVFAGGWTLEAAEAVCAGVGLEPYELLDVLTQLVNKSLVAVEREQGEEARYRLLETIREYALERLAASGEAETVRREQAKFFLALAQEADPLLASATRSIVLERLKIEHDNLRAALQWARESGEALMGLQMAGALLWLWYFFGYLSEGRSWLEGALAQAAMLDAPTARAKALMSVGSLAWIQGDYTIARAWLEESKTISRTLGPVGKRNLAEALMMLGLAVRDQGDPAGARSLLEESVVTCREIGDQWGLAKSLASLGRTLIILADPAAARPILEECQAIFRKLGDKWGLAMSLNNLGLAALQEGDYGRAMGLYQEGVVLFWEVGEKFFAARCLEELAWAISMQGAYDRATRLFGAAEAQRKALGVSLPPNERAEHERHIAAAQARLGETAFAAAFAEGRAMTMEEAIAYALENRNQASETT